MLAAETSMGWSLKRRGDDIDEEFEDFEEDKDLDDDFDDELDEEDLDEEDLEDLDDYDDLDDEFDDEDEDGFRPRKGRKREWDCNNRQAPTPPCWPGPGDPAYRSVGSLPISFFL